MNRYAAREKYDRPGRARRYAERSPKREEEEWALLERGHAGLGHVPADALDAPCGTGRVAERLIDRGIPTRCADLSPAMRDETLGRLRGRAGFLGVVPLDLEEAPPAAIPPADLVVCFRFLHHLPDEATRGRVLRTLRALTKASALVSFHHPVSPHNVLRRVRTTLLRRRSDRHTLSPKRLRAEAEAAGFDVLALLPLRRWFRELWLAVLAPRPS